MPTCPHCSGHSPADATWCTQCYRKFEATTRPSSGATAFEARENEDARPHLGSESAKLSAVGTLDPPIERHPGWRPPLSEPPTPTKKPHQLEAAGRSTLLVLLAIGAGAAAQWAIQHLARGGNATNNDLINDGLTLTVLVYLVVGALIVTFLRITGTTLRWHEGDPLRSAGAGVLRGIAIAVAVTGIVAGAAGHLQGDARFTALLSENNGVRILCTILIAVVAAPLVEETLFRGLLLESWRRYAIGSLVLSGFAFAAWHLIGSAIIYYWMMGIVLGRVYVRRGLIGSMAAHATFNAIVLGVTIASISGSGHDYRTGALHMHTPPTWHVHSQQVNSAGNELVLTGPSGSSLALVVFNNSARLTPEQAAANTKEQIAANVSKTGASPSDWEPIELPIGAGERLNISDGTHQADFYVVTTASHTYILGIDAASSKTAANQIPGILNSLSED